MADMSALPPRLILRPANFGQIAAAGRAAPRRALRRLRAGRATGGVARGRFWLRSPLRGTSSLSSVGLQNISAGRITLHPFVRPQRPSLGPDLRPGAPERAAAVKGGRKATVAFSGGLPLTGASTLTGFGRSGRSRERRG